MATTITHPTAGLGNAPLTLTLPPALAWVDEFSWAKVQQTKTYTTTGALLVDHAVRQTGRTVTLRGGTDYGWCNRGDLKTLRAWADQPGVALQLSIRGLARTVVFDHEAGAVEAEPVIDYDDPEDTDPYQVTLRFTEI